MAIAYKALTETCTLLLDGNGVCRSVALAAVAASSGRVARIPASAERCIGAQFVATLDLRDPSGLTHMPTIGAPMLFARVESDGRITLVRSAPVVRFETVAQVDSGVRPRPAVSYGDNDERTTPMEVPIELEELTVPRLPTPPPPAAARAASARPAAARPSVAPPAPAPARLTAPPRPSPPPAPPRAERSASVPPPRAERSASVPPPRAERSASVPPPRAERSVWAPASRATVPAVERIAAHPAPHMAAPRTERRASVPPPRVSGKMPIPREPDYTRPARTPPPPPRLPRVSMIAPSAPRQPAPARTPSPAAEGPTLPFRRATGG